MPVILSRVAAVCDDVYPPTGSLGYIVLLNNTVATNLEISSLNTSGTGLVTMTAAHGLVTGTRVRMISTGTYPSVTGGDFIDPAVDYWINVASSTTLTLHLSQSTAIAGTSPVTFTGSGTGTLRLNEQNPVVTDNIEVFINHEIDHPDYYRKELVDVGTASTTTGYKPAYTWEQNVGVSSPPMTIRYVLVLLGGSSTIGSTTGDKDQFSQYPADVTIAPANSKTLRLDLFFRAATATV